MKFKSLLNLLMPRTTKLDAIPNWALFLIPCLVFSIFGLKNLGLPGLYMDSVNPDYLAAWMQHQVAMPAWTYPDNYFSAQHPLLNSLYGGNSTAYLAALFFKIMGYGAIEVRLFHCLLAVALLMSMCWFLLQWRTPKLLVVLFVSLLASEPTFVFVWRTQYYLQLYPVIFLFLGLGVLGKLSNNDGAPAIRPGLLLLSGIFFGFSAYSYFIFAIYSAVILLAFFILKRNTPNKYRSTAYLTLGTLLGFLPYIYAHASILLNTNLQSYIESLKGLQTAYGVIDNNQGGFFDKLDVLRDRLGQLLSAKGLEMLVFGESPIGLLRAVIAESIFFAIPAIYIGWRLLAVKWHPQGENGFAIRNKAFLFLVLLSCFIVHIAFGCYMGRPLGIQHYIMLMPLACATAATLFSTIDSLNPTAPIKAAVNAALAVACVLLLALNFSISYKFSGRLQNEGGRKMFSDAINITGTYINGMPRDTAILFPQWGYWMGFVTISGPRFDTYQSHTLEDMESKLLQDPGLLKHKKFALVLNPDNFEGDNLATSPTLEAFAARTGLQLKGITTIHGRNGVDTAIIVHLARK